mgnify:CR=1 FL=1
MLKPYHIAIEGNIGVGKTSLAKILATELGGDLVLERFEENPFLSDFYVDPKKYALQTQLFFLLSRYKQQIELKQIDLFSKAIISDYMFIKDRLFAMLNLDDRELDLYDSVAKILESNIISPDLVIFLQSDTNRLMDNIHQRGRDYELKMESDYLNNLGELYNKYFFTYTDSPLIIINSNDIDFVNNKSDLKQILDFIKTPPSGTEYFNPTIQK